MIVHSLCNTCFQRYEIRVEPNDVPLLKQLADEHWLTGCPRHCGGKINLSNPSDHVFKELVNNPMLKDPLSLTAQELFKAAKGGGLPDEIPKSMELVVALLKSSPVVGVNAQFDGKNVYLHEIALENGSCIHLAAGSRGAQVLKITKEK